MFLDGRLNPIEGALPMIISIRELNIKRCIFPLNYKELETLEEIRKIINKARGIQLERYKSDNIYSNSQMNSSNIKNHCKLNKGSETTVRNAFNKYGFSTRTYNKILKVGRTIADLDNKDIITENHVLEAVRYKSLDNKYWG